MVDRIPRPKQLDPYLDDIVHAVGLIRDAYRWAWPDAFRRPKHAAQDAVSGGAPSDVADLVIATSRFRARVAGAAHSVAEARQRLQRAVADLNDAMALLEPPPTAEVADVRCLPHPADRGDIARAREAQERRRLRAVRTGDWDEVIG